MPDRILALVTGAAGGIGQAVCARLAGQGHNVLCVERDETLAEKAPTGVPPLTLDTGRRTLVFD